MKQLWMNAQAYEVTAWHRFGAGLTICRSRLVMAELQGVILSVLLIKENDESLYVIYLLEGQTYIHNRLLCHDAAAK